jgi:hypothetical protein
MTPLDVPPQTLLQLRQRPRPGRSRKQTPVHILRRITADPANHDLLTVIVPLEDRAGADAKLSANFGGY